MIKICTDSCVDLSEEQISKFNISVLPLSVILGDEEYLDDVNIKPNQIFEYVNKNGTLPKTSARSVEDFKFFFNDLLKDDNEVIYTGISSKLSSTYQNAIKAKKEIGSNKLHIVDSKSLSTGIGLLVIYACKLVQMGATCEEIVKQLEYQANLNQTSFVVDKLDYLYKGGRCSAIVRFGANLLKIKTRLELKDGKIENTGKYMGQFRVVVKKYIDDMLKVHSNIKKDICFITHTCSDKQFVEQVVEYVKSKNIFETVLSSTAGATISCHCGENTLGILYLLENN